MEELQREPWYGIAPFPILVVFLWCLFYSPWRILEDCGAAFIMGCVGGGLYSFGRGYRNSPPVSSLLVMGYTPEGIDRKVAHWMLA